MIKINARSMPFSHRPGISCLVPGTHLIVKIYPVRLSFFQADTLLFHHDLDWEGPVFDFTVQLDLERLQVRVFGHTQKGFLRYVLQRKDNAIKLSGRILPYALQEDLLVPSTERLSLGMHKKQEWERVVSRLDFKEIFPLWLRLGQVTPPVLLSSVQGTLRLLQDCQALVHEGRKNDIIAAFKKLFLAGFEGMLVPRLFDTDYQGILSAEEGTKNGSALALLTQGAAVIRSLFFQEKNGIISLLPCLPPEFHAGRFVDLRTLAGDRLDIEWTKKEMRRVILYPASQAVHLQFPKHLKRCRVRSARKEKGRIYVLKDGLLPIIATGRTVWIDCFQK